MGPSFLVGVEGADASVSIVPRFVDRLFTPVNQSRKIDLYLAIRLMQRRDLHEMMRDEGKRTKIFRCESTDVPLQIRTLASLAHTMSDGRTARKWRDGMRLRAHSNNRPKPHKTLEDFAAIVLLSRSVMIVVDSRPKVISHPCSSGISRHSCIA